jgi:hypothetical protein
VTSAIYSPRSEEEHRLLLGPGRDGAERDEGQGRQRVGPRGRDGRADAVRRPDKRIPVS